MTPLKLALCIGGILLFSYPLLSHDFFNYLFDAKILTYYHQNPYAHKALDFPHDPWLRFMHWTHRTYPYGPTFLLISLVPSFLSFGKFILAYFFFKIMFVFFYLTSVYTLQKRNTSWGLLFATNPLVIVEGLMNTHNDLIGLALVFIGLYFLQEKKQLLGRIFLVLSIGIKYVTLPFIIFSTIFKKTQVVLALAVIVLMLVWLKFFEIQPWYFLLLLGLIPFYKDAINKSFLFFAGLLFSYYPYMRFGNWSKQFQLDMKHEIILIFFVLNLIYFAINFLRKKFFIK